MTINRRRTEVVNNSGSTALFFDQVLAPGEVWEIIDRKLEMWRDDITISGAISSGTLGVRDGTQEFTSVTNALKYFYDNPAPVTTLKWPQNSLVTLASGIDAFGGIEYEFQHKSVVGVGGLISVVSGTEGIEIIVNDGADVDSLTASGVTVTGSVQLNSIAGISISADDNTDTVTISGGVEIGSNIGNFFQIEFSSVGITNNTWLSVSSKDLTSNITPWPVVFPCRIAGLGYSNERVDSDCDIELHVSPIASGSNNSPIFTWSVTDSRVAYKSDFGLDELILNPGDKLAIFGGNAGDTRPKNMFLGVYVEILSRQNAEDSENFSGDFS